MNYYIEVIADTVTQVFVEGKLPRKANGVYPDGTKWVANLNKVNPALYVGFNVYPCTMSGTGTLPAVGTITWDSGPKTGSGTLVPVVPSRHITPREFKSKFTNAEKAAIYASTDALVRSYLDDLVMAPYVDLDLQDNIDGLAYLVAQGLLTADRPAVILA